MKDKKVEVIYECLEEIISCLCYQPEIPLQHKTDMLNKLFKVGEAYYGANKAKETKQSGLKAS